MEKNFGGTNELKIHESDVYVVSNDLEVAYLKSPSDFEIKRNIIKIEKEGEGTVFYQNDNDEYVEFPEEGLEYVNGEALYLKAEPAVITVGETTLKFDFDGWYANNKLISTEKSCVVTANNNIVYEARFSLEYTAIWYTADNEEKIFTTENPVISSSTYSSVITDKTTITKLVLGKNVTTIGKSAFDGCTNLININMSSSITTIGQSAFYNTGIKELVIRNDGAEELLIQLHSFGGCKNLEKVEIGNNAKLIGRSFEDSTNIKTVKLGENIKTQRDFGGPFVRCSKIEQLTVESLDSVCEGAFEGITNLKGQLGDGTGNGKVVINDGVTAIETSAFKGCKCIEEVVLPDDVVEIKGSAFENCENLKKINITEKKMTYGSSAFVNCSNLEINLIIENGSKIGSYAFHNTGIKELVIKNEGSEEILIPLHAFAECENLEKVEIGNNAKLIGRSFEDSTNIKTVKLGENIKTQRDFGGPFVRCSKIEQLTVESLDSVCEGAFEGITNLKGQLGDGTGNGKVVINNGTTTIGGNAFSGCTNLTNINIPNSVTSIGTNAFYGITGTINIDAASGSISSSPWGGTNATINWLR